MFLSKVSGKRCSREQRDRKPAFHYNPEGPCLQINGLLIRDAQYRRGRPLGGSTACGRKRTSISENCMVEAACRRPREQQLEKAWGRASTKLSSDGLVFVMPLSRANPMVRGARIRRYRAPVCSCRVSIHTNCLIAAAPSGCISTFEFPMLQQ